MIIAKASFTPLNFLVFGLVGSVPFFVFNVWFRLVEPVLKWMLLDLAGNVSILLIGIWGWRRSRREQAQAAGGDVLANLVFVDERSTSRISCLFVGDSVGVLT